MCTANSMDLHMYAQGDLAEWWKCWNCYLDFKGNLNIQLTLQAYYNM